MLISCSSCNSKYLVNSADLKPNGRMLECSICGHNWFQNTNIEQEEPLIRSTPLSKSKNHQPINLPSTYVKETKPSIFNTILIIIFLIFIIVFFWFLNQNGLSFFLLINFYFQEFFFNLKLIINDLILIIDQIVKF